MSAVATTVTRWWWVRHAPVRDDGGRIYGQHDLSCDCSDRAVFEQLARQLPRGALWFTSTLIRTHETAAAIRAAMDDDRCAGNEAPLRGISDFREQDLGAWQGLDRARFHASRDMDPASYWFAPADERAPGGESFADLVERTGRAIDQLEQECRGRDAIVVAHGGTIRAAVALALDLRPQSALSLAIGNCSVTRLDHHVVGTRRGWRVAMINHQPWRLGAPAGPAG